MVIGNQVGDLDVLRGHEAQFLPVALTLLLLNKMLHVLLTVLVTLQFRNAIQRRPLGLIFKEAHGMDELASPSVIALIGQGITSHCSYVRFIGGEAMIDSRG